MRSISMVEGKKVNSIDLFAGCGGLMDGFEQTGLYNTLACVEWEKAPCVNLRKRLREKWNYQDADQRVLQFDIQRTKELFEGWTDDPLYGQSVGLDELVGDHNELDLIIGGPPCQAYSVAGRIRDENGMNDDYRNYLFEKYIEVVKRYRPKVFIFENVPGMLSACPNGIQIADVIKEKFSEIGYEIISDLKEAIVDFTEYGVPQNRKRIIILGLNKDVYGENCQSLIDTFYKELLSRHKVKKKVTVQEAIGDLPKLYPLEHEIKVNGKKYSHSLPTESVFNHFPRWQSQRDINTFKLLTEDIESEKLLYTSTQALKQLYTELTGKASNVHKYYVLRWNEQSNTIPAHLYKDGLRHIHPDPQQARTLTVREAARLQTFADDYEFIGSQMDQYKMIGNAVPPRFAKILAETLYEILSAF
jgi:DNA-cytosine methyltransferase